MEDPGFVSRWAGAVATGATAIVAASVAVIGWINGRFERHKKDSDKQAENLRVAILDLYAKNEDRRDQVEEVRREMSTGFLQVEKTLHAIHTELLRQK